MFKKFYLTSLFLSFLISPIPLKAEEVTINKNNTPLLVEMVCKNYQVIFEDFYKKIILSSIQDEKLKKTQTQFLIQLNDSDFWLISLIYFQKQLSASMFKLLNTSYFCYKNRFYENKS